MANTIPRGPIPQHDHYIEARYPRLLGGETLTLGPFHTLHAARKRAAAMRAPYPGDQQPAIRHYAIER